MFLPLEITVGDRRYNFIEIIEEFSYILQFFCYYFYDTYVILFR